MKKILTAVCLAFAVFAMQAQSVKIMKNGVAVATYEASEFDEVVFTPADSETPGLSALAGNYEAHLAVSLVELAQQGVLIDEDTKFSITATSESAITLSLPGCYYEAMNMKLPGVTVDNVELTEADGVYTFSKDYSFTEEGTEKAVSGTVSGIINSDRTFNINNKMKYGSMPFTINEVFTPIVKSE